MLRRGEVDAIVAIEGKPVQWLSQITDRNLHLVPVDYAKNLQEEYLPSKLSSQDYPNLVADGASVETVAAEAVLASYNWAPNSDRYRRLALLVDTMFDKVDAAAAAAVPSEVEGNGAAGDGVGVDPLQGGAGMARSQYACRSASVSAASGALPQQQSPPSASSLPQERDALYKRIPGMARQPHQDR